MIASSYRIDNYILLLATSVMCVLSTGHRPSRAPLLPRASSAYIIHPTSTFIKCQHTQAVHPGSTLWAVGSTHQILQNSVSSFTV